MSIESEIEDLKDRIDLLENIIIRGLINDINKDIEVIQTHIKSLNDYVFINPKRNKSNLNVDIIKQHKTILKIDNIKQYKTMKI